MDKQLQAGVRHNLNKMFDKWYAEHRPKSPNRTRLVQKYQLAPMNNDDEAIRLSRERDRLLKKDSTKEVRSGTSS